jgi:hypothetical protein
MILIYLDPGSGSFLIQLLIAGVAGAGLAIAVSWQKIKRFFNKKKNVIPNEDDDDSDEPDA